MEHLDYMYPSPHFSDAKMARFSRFFIIALRGGGWGFAVLIYFVQDCRLDFHRSLECCPSFLLGGARTLGKSAGPFPEQRLEIERTLKRTLSCRLRSFVSAMMGVVLHQTGMLRR